MQAKKLLYSKSRGAIAGVIGGLVVGIVMLFVGLFMVNAVHNATSLYVNGSGVCTSVFCGVQTNLITLTGTVFSVLGLVIIIVALATAIGSLRNVTG